MDAASTLLRHQRSQSEIVVGDIMKFRKLNRPNSMSQLQATSVNRLYRVSACEDLLLPATARARSWTWNGTDAHLDADEGVFSVELPAFSNTTECVSLKSYSQESIIEDSDNNDEAKKISSLRLEKSAVKDIISDVLVTEFLNGHYDANVATEQCTLVSQRIQAAVCSMLDVDVKIVAAVHMGEQKGQAVEISCQCLWDPEMDNLVTVSFQDKCVFAICTVFVVHT